jgi:hypothetical protein
MAKTLSKVSEMKGWKRVTVAPGTKHPDGVYSTLEGERFVIDGGVLFVPTELLEPNVEFMGFTRLVLVKSVDGGRQMFVRGGDFLELRPEAGELVRDVARVYGCSL